MLTRRCQILTEGQGGAWLTLQWSIHATRFLRMRSYKTVTEHFTLGYSRNECTFLHMRSYKTVTKLRNSGWLYAVCVVLK